MSKLPVILQEEMADCGHACVAMISQYWGHKFNLALLKKRYVTSTRGVTLRELHHMLDDLGFKVNALRIAISDLKNVPCPAILHWNNNHFVVLKKIKKKYVVVHDPVYGEQKYTFDFVATVFSGVVVEVDKAVDFTACTENKTLRLLDLIKSITGISRWFRVLFMLSLTLEALTLLTPLLMQFVTDQVVASQDRHALLMVTVSLLWISCVHGFIDYIRGSLVLYLSTHLLASFSSNVMRHLLRLPLHFFERRHKGDLQAKMQSIDQLQKKISIDLINTGLDGVMIVLHLIVMLIYSQILTSIVLCSMLVYALVRCLSYSTLQKNTALSVNLHTQVASIFLETLQGIKPIKIFVKETLRLQTWQDAFNLALNAELQVSKIQLKSQVLQRFMWSVEWILVVSVGAYQVLQQQTSIGGLMAFLGYRLLFVNTMASWIQSAVEFKLTRVQLTRLGDVVLQDPEIISTNKTKDISIIGALTLNQVSFKHHAYSQTIIHNLSLDIQAGEKVALVGASGCGKTTILMVMMGLLKPSSGELYIDGIQLDDLGIQNYREHIAAVLQDDVLLSGSILNNIVFFDDHIDIHRVYAVAQQACIHDFILSCPMGYATLVGESGQTISGGQKQRILLARALYKQPKILFLDEASSHLDVTTEMRINNTLKHLSMTQIIVAHREESIRMADRVIHLDVLQ